MKRTACVLIALLVLPLFLYATGCNSNESKAKEFMQKGDSLSSEIQSIAQSSEESVMDLLTAFGLDLFAASAGAWETSSGEVIDKIDLYKENVEVAKKEYGRILDLDGVEEYKKYAELRIKSLDSLASVLKGMKVLVDDLGVALSKGKSVKDATGKWLDENKYVEVDLAKSLVYWAEAALYKSRNNLGGDEADEVQEKEAETNGTVPGPE
ncbi:MAG: hypothetical protein JXA49_04050 [Actinobacteria bacterium]|nr:hypothetical protein [Actinomycetota bacterium]